MTNYQVFIICRSTHQPKGRGSSPRSSAASQYHCGHGFAGCSQIKSGPKGYDQNVGLRQPQASSPLIYRLVDGAGNIKLTKDGKVLLTEMVRNKRSAY